MKYQTETQVLLYILLEGVIEDLDLSNQRMEALTKQNDLDCLEVEREINSEFTNKKEMILKMISMESNSHASSPSIIRICRLNRDGEEVVYDEYHSDVLGDLNV